VFSAPGRFPFLLPFPGLFNNSLDIKVGTKKFKFTKVSILISEMYAELTNMAYGHADLGDELEQIGLEYEIAVEEAESPVEKKRAKLAHTKDIRDLKKRSYEITKEIFDKRFEILAELLDLNGYGFDDMLWRKNASVEQINDIMVDAVGSGSKKKLTST